MRTGDLVVQLEYAEQSVELEDENWRLCSTILVLQCALHSSLLFSVRFPGGAHAASPLTSSPNALETTGGPKALFIT